MPTAGQTRARDDYTLTREARGRSTRESCCPKGQYRASAVETSTHLGRAIVTDDTTPNQRLLYVSASAPALAGGGQAMRAGAIVRALSQRFRVTLLVTAGHGEQALPIPEAVRACCERVLRQGRGEPLSRRERFDIVHVFRRDALADAEPWLRWSTERQIDLDDPESVSEQRLATFARVQGRSEQARQSAEAAERARVEEDVALTRFDRVFVSSEGSRQALLRRNVEKAEVVVLPNSLPLPKTTPFPPLRRGTFTLLFVGRLGHGPNDDALQHFCANILPRIQAGADRPVTLRIVGTGDPAAVRRLDGQAGVELVGAVPDVEPWYRDAHVAIAPMRAGGGSRIKVLEAFALRRPVVATTTGMEGIAAEDGREAYISDDPARFADDCLRLLHDPELAAGMAEEAFGLFRHKYTDERINGIVVGIIAHSDQGAALAGDE